MDLERERGITIKAQSVTLNYSSRDGSVYQLNFIDTPGHRFFLRGLRSLAACEARYWLSMLARGSRRSLWLTATPRLSRDWKCFQCSTKWICRKLTQTGCSKRLRKLSGLMRLKLCQSVRRPGLVSKTFWSTSSPMCRPLRATVMHPCRLLIIDSWFDNYLGVVSLVRVKQGQLSKRDKFIVRSTGKQHQADLIGVFTPRRTETGCLMAGEVGFVVAGIKDIKGAPVGDALIAASHQETAALPGFPGVKPQVYAGIFTVNSDDYEDFRDALGKLTLNDASLFYEPETSDALGFGFRCGFLGMLHMEIIQERLEREYNLDLITTAPTVIYEIVKKTQETVYVDNPSKLPDVGDIEIMREPIARCTILTPQRYLGAAITLCVEKRGTQVDLQFLGQQVQVIYDIPMAEVVLDFFDRLKSVSRGYASLDYGFERFEAAPLSRSRCAHQWNRVDALAIIVHRDHVQSRGRVLTEKMKELIPRQMFDVAIQAAVGGKIVARQTVKALRKMSPPSVMAVT